ncbi:conjugative transfer system coupling protein TraD [Parasutterella secunda]|uniref:Conjugative transfer system coupling protein TraD n=1 Tax=Parasutterella secunda TaxID=626947 RepID=A0ABS2GT61_9BURK|nr:conjugative transfer system coupling protein TraD [Parasutterella secunda]MBM6928988.1 conjugative transfer system coupling protein TraD [Parasutterella secunda]
MSDAQKTSQTFERYECWRPAYESFAVLAWFIAFGWVSWLYFTERLPLTWCAILWTITLAMLIKRAFEMLKVLNARAALSGSQLAFMTFEELARIMKGHTNDLWLGYGFRWWPEHSQKLYELMKLDWTKLLLPSWLTRLLLKNSELPDEAAGLPIIHGVSTYDDSLFRPLKNFEGGLCLCGTTQAGKGVYLSHLVAQAIARGDVVIVIDPKHSSRLKDNILHACRASGRDDPLTFHPAFPDTGVRLDPMHSFTNATEIASRIRQAFPPNMDESFANFAWMAVNAIAQGLIALESRPTLPLIAKYVKLGIYDILEPLLEKHAREYAPKDWQKHYLDLKEKAGKPPAPNVTERLMVLVALYETDLHHIAPDPAIDGLIEVFRHNREHYSKITASLLPILSMLTTGKLADSLSPTIVDMHDTRPVMNLEKIINGGHVLYIGLDSMPNPTVASTLAGIWLADLANIAGRRYNLGLSALNSRRISLFVDEVSNVINVPLIEILNKGAESGIATTCAMQTIADLAHRMGSLEAAHVVLGNLNNLIALRTKDQMTQNFVVETLGNTYIANQSLSINNRAPDHLSPDYHSGLTRQMNSELEPIFPPEFLGKLPNCEAIVQVSAGYIYKTRCPILVSKR